MFSISGLTPEAVYRASVFRPRVTSSLHQLEMLKPINKEILKDQRTGLSGFTDLSCCVLTGKEYSLSVFVVGKVTCSKHCMTQESRKPNMQAVSF